VEVGIAGQFRPSLIEVSYVACRVAPLEMTGGTKGGAQRARTFKDLGAAGGSPVTATLNLPSIYQLNNKTIN
jgi:hypothetical protein